MNKIQSVWRASPSQKAFTKMVDWFSNSNKRVEGEIPVNAEPLKVDQNQMSWIVKYV